MASITINTHASCPCAGVLKQLKRQELLLGKIMTTVNELAAKLEAVNAQLTKASQEIVAQVAALEAALSNTVLTAEAETALENLSNLATLLDDLNPDAEPPVA